jgi:peptidyl-prolyl cis-trans isomerase C
MVLYFFVWGWMSLPVVSQARKKENENIMGVVRVAIILGAVLISLGTRAGAAEKPAVQAGGAAAVKTTDKPAGKAASGETLVATVNGVGISRVEFDRNWEYFLQRSGIPANHADKSGEVDEFRKQVLDRLVDEELLFQESTRLRQLAGKESVDAEVEKARAQFPTAEAFAQALAQNKLTEESLRGVIARNLSIQGFVEKEVAAAVVVSDGEGHEFYAGNRDKFEMPEEAHARHILVQVDEKADEKTRQSARAKADDLLAQLKGGANFEELARKSSDCSSAPQGGDLGFFAHGQMVPAFDQAAFALQPGEISGLVETQFGYHIIKLEEKKAAGLVSEPEAGGRIREYLLSQKTEAAVAQRLKTLRDKAKIELLLKL